MALGNSEAVKAAQARERKPATPSPAKETATAKRASTPERETPEKKPAPRKLTEEEEFAERMRHNFPEMSDAEIKALHEIFAKSAPK